MAKFNILSSGNGQFYFTLVARNGKCIATSETYLTRQACYKGITSVQRNAPVADIIERGTVRHAGVMCCMDCEWVGDESKAVKSEVSDEFYCPECDSLCVPEQLDD